VEPQYSIRKLAQAATGRAPVRVKVANRITTAAEEKLAAIKRAEAAHLPSLRRKLFKEAATIPDPTAVDVVLSLGFLNPENLFEFVSYLPVIDQAQTRMCELLLAARLGLQDIPIPALERAVRTVEEVVDGLENTRPVGGARVSG
jgi:hypothetical protein